MSALFAVFAVSDSLLDRVNALYFKLLVWERLQIDLPVIILSETGKKAYEEKNQTQDIIRAFAEGIPFAYKIHDHLSADLAKARAVFPDYYPLYLAYAEHIKHVRFIRSEKVLEDFFTLYEEQREQKHSTAVIQKLQEKSHASVKGRLQWSDMVSLTYQHNQTLVNDTLEEVIFVRMREQNVAGDLKKIYQDMCSYLQNHTKIVLAFRANEVFDMMPVSFSSVNFMEMQALDLKNSRWKDWKNDRYYVDGRKQIEDKMFDFIPGIKEKFEAMPIARPRYSFLVLANDANIPLPLNRNYGESYFVLRDVVKLNSLFLPYDSRVPGPMPCSYYHFGILLQNVSDNLFYGLVHAVSGQLPERKIKQNDKYYETHTFFPPLNLFDSHVVERIYVSPNEHKLGNAERQFIESHGIIVSDCENAYSDVRKQIEMAVSTDDKALYDKLTQPCPYLKKTQIDALTAGDLDLYQFLLQHEPEVKPASMQTLCQSVPAEKLHLFLQKFSYEALDVLNEDALQSVVDMIQNVMSRKVSNASWGFVTNVIRYFYDRKVEVSLRVVSQYQALENPDAEQSESMRFATLLAFEVAKKLICLKDVDKLLELTYSVFLAKEYITHLKRAMFSLLQTICLSFPADQTHLFLEQFDYEEVDVLNEEALQSVAEVMQNVLSQKPSNDSWHFVMKTMKHFRESKVEVSRDLVSKYSGLYWPEPKDDMRLNFISFLVRVIVKKLMVLEQADKILDLIRHGYLSKEDVLFLKLSIFSIKFLSPVTRYILKEKIVSLDGTNEEIDALCLGGNFEYVLLDPTFQFPENSPCRNTFAILQTLIERFTDDRSVERLERVEQCIVNRYQQGEFANFTAANVNDLLTLACGYEQRLYYVLFACLPFVEHTKPYQRLRRDLPLDESRWQGTLNSGNLLAFINLIFCSPLGTLQASGLVTAFCTKIRNLQGLAELRPCFRSYATLEYYIPELLDMWLNEPDLLEEDQLRDLLFYYMSPIKHDYAKVQALLVKKPGLLHATEGKTQCSLLHYAIMNRFSVLGDDFFRLLCTSRAANTVNVWQQSCLQLLVQRLRTFSGSNPDKKIACLLEHSTFSDALLLQMLEIMLKDSIQNGMQHFKKSFKVICTVVKERKAEAETLNTCFNEVMNLSPYQYSDAFAEIKNVPTSILQSVIFAFAENQGNTDNIEVGEAGLNRLLDCCEKMELSFDQCEALYKCNQHALLQIIQHRSYQVDVHHRDLLLAMLNESTHVLAEAGEEPSLYSLVKALVRCLLRFPEPEKVYTRLEDHIQLLISCQQFKVVDFLRGLSESISKEMAVEIKSNPGMELAIQESKDDEPANTYNRNMTFKSAQDIQESKNDIDSSIQLTRQ